MPNTTSRLGLTEPIGTDDVSELRASITSNANILDGACVYLTGELAGLPAAAAVPAGTEYYASDVSMIFKAVGTGSAATAWVNTMFTPGDLKCSAIGAAPTGWLLCNGAAVSRTTYAFLYNAIGTAYGAGDGTTTFNVPDLRGRLPLGAGTGTASGATAWARGAQPTTGAGGEQSHQLTAEESGVPSHTHVTDPADANTTSADFGGGALWTQNGTVVATDGNGQGEGTSLLYGNGGFNIGLLASVPEMTVASNEPAGADTAHNTMPPVSVVNWFIKT